VIESLAVIITLKIVIMIDIYPLIIERHTEVVYFRPLKPMPLIWAILMKYFIFFKQWQRTPGNEKYRMFNDYFGSEVMLKIDPIIR